MKLLLTPDSFKGTFSAIEAAQIMKEAILSVDANADITLLPMADGGEHSLDCISALDMSEIKTVIVESPYAEKVAAKYALTPDFAFIEMAEASGLLLTTPKQRNPMKASTYGTGQLILDALNQGCRKIILCLGGSATNDGGAGMAEAMGVRFFHQKRQIRGIPEELQFCDEMDVSFLDSRIQETEFILACDVDNPLCGPLGASRVFGPQKGASAALCTQLDSILDHYSTVVESTLAVNCRNLPGAGAAGGLGFGLMAFAQAHCQSGIDTLLELTHFHDLAKEADLIITGEGKTDFQTLHGKTPIGVAKAAKKLNKPTLLISGSVELSSDKLAPFGIIQAYSCKKANMSTDEAIEQAASLLHERTIEAYQEYIKELNHGLL